MCAVNDRKREDYNKKIKQLKLEYSNEERKRIDIVRACSEINQLLDNSQCIINNISECNLGGNKIISSIKISEQGYKERIDFYNEYLIKCQEAIEKINKEINETTRLRDTLPKNCGCCQQCRSIVNNNSLKEV